MSDVRHLASSDYHKIMLIAPSNHKWKLLSDCRLRSDKQIIALFVGCSRSGDGENPLNQRRPRCHRDKQGGMEPFGQHGGRAAADQTFIRRGCRGNYTGG